PMTVPELPRRSRAGGDKRGRDRRDDATTPGKLPPLLVALGIAALVVLVAGGAVLALLLLHGSRGSGQEVVGTALPPVWQPGSERGVGPVPPPPLAGAAAPVGSVPPAPEA